MKHLETKEIEKLVRSLRQPADTQANARILGGLLDTVRQRRSRAASISSMSLGRIVMRNPMTGIAVAAVVVILFAAYSFNERPAWARVVKAFNAAPDVHLVRTDILEQGVAMNSHEAWIKNQNLFRLETDGYCIVDDGRRVLTLYRGLKIAHVRDSFTPYWDYTPVILQIFVSGGYRDGITVTQRPGERTDATDAYSIDFRDQWAGTAWVNRLTNLPVRIAGKLNKRVGQAAAFEVRFDYDTVPDSLFATSIPAGYREIPNLPDDRGSSPQDHPLALAGTVTDAQGGTVPDARIFASYAGPGRTDTNGVFALSAPPTDGSGSIGPVDLPMFVWAYTEGDLHKVAWTVVRPPRSYEPNAPYPHIEETQQGVVLTIADENDFRRNLPGDPGRLAGDGSMEGNPQIADVALISGPAHTIAGQVTDANGVPAARTVILVETLELQIGSNTLRVARLGDQWKAGFLTTTNDKGRYCIGHLPPGWTHATLAVQIPGRGSFRQSVLPRDQDTTCDIVLGPGAM